MIPAIILCGGKGTRMGQDAPPKCLTKIGDIPIIDRTYEYLRKNTAIEKFILAVGYRSQEVKDHFTGASDVSFSDFGEDASMLDRIREAAKLTSGTFLVCYGDEYADVDLGELLDIHNRSNAYITITCHQVESNFGVVKISGERIVDFSEKPLQWVNVGYQIWSMSKLSRLFYDGQSLPSLFKAVSKIGRMAGYAHTGKRFTVNEPQDIAKAEAILAE